VQVTIDGIRFVADSGRAKEMLHDIASGGGALQVGRAGVMVAGVLAGAWVGCLGWAGLDGLRAGCCSRYPGAAAR
jgi:hypothetical protein